MSITSVGNVLPAAAKHDFSLANYGKARRQPGRKRSRLDAARRARFTIAMVDQDNLLTGLIDIQGVDNEFRGRESCRALPV
jgi:hypothetical protein